MSFSLEKLVRDVNISLGGEFDVFIAASKLHWQVLILGMQIPTWSKIRNIITSLISLSIESTFSLPPLDPGQYTSRVFIYGRSLIYLHICFFEFLGAPHSASRRMELKAAYQNQVAVCRYLGCSISIIVIIYFNVCGAFFSS